MGAQQSNIQRVAASTAVLNAAYQGVILGTTELIAQAVSLGWHPGNTEDMCRRIALTRRDTFDWLDVNDLVGVRGRVGITLSPPFDITTTQQAEALRRACAIDVEYNTTKVRLAAYVRQNVRALCHDTRDEIARNMPLMLQGATQQQQDLSYARLRRLDGLLTGWYQRIGALLNMAATDVTLDQLRRIGDEAQTLVRSGYSQCCQAVHDLRDFAWIGYTETDGTQRYVNWYIPGEPIVGILPRIVVTGLSGPSQPGTVACGRQIDFNEADLEAAVSPS